MSIDRLWSGWRAAYVVGDGGRPPRRLRSRRDGPACSRRSCESGLPDDETNIVHRGATCFAILNAFPYTSGTCWCCPYREVADLEELDADETAELWATVTDAVGAVRARLPPEGVNVGINLGRAGGRSA